MVNKAKNKGRRKEHATIAFLGKYGFDSERLGGYGKVDVRTSTTANTGLTYINPINIQVKARKEEPKTLVKHLAGNDLLFIWGDRSQDPLVTMRGTTLMNLMGRIKNE
jgi:hypothetical protein